MFFIAGFQQIILSLQDEVRQGYLSHSLLKCSHNLILPHRDLLQFSQVKRLLCSLFSPVKPLFSVSQSEARPCCGWGSHPVLPWKFFSSRKGSFSSPQDAECPRFVGLCYQFGLQINILQSFPDCKLQFFSSFDLPALSWSSKQASHDSI